MPFRDYYAILGVTRDASSDTILRAYRARAFERHPDRNPGDPRAEMDMRLLNEAIAVLRDAIRRRTYDGSLQQSVRCNWQAGDVEYTITITPEQALYGTTYTMSFHNAQGQSYAVPITVPPRAQLNARIVIPGAGGPAYNGSQRGDLIVVIKIAQSAPQSYS